MTSAPTRATSVVQYRTSGFRCSGCPGQPGRARALGCLRLCQGADGCRRCRHGAVEIPADPPPGKQGAASTAQGWRAVRRGGAFMIG